MKLTFISPYSIIQNCGIRIISAALRNAGHQTNMIYLNAMRFEGPHGDKAVRDSRHLVGQIRDIAADSDMIGITLMSPHYPAAVELTQALRPLKKRIIWGGTHPTLLPEECFKHVDMICVGEGEQAILELVETLESGREPHRLQNIWVKGQPRSPLRTLSSEWSSPRPDYGPEGHYAFDRTADRLVELGRLEDYQKHMVNYRVEVSRGCPYSCTYCANNTLRRIYPGRYLRFKPLSLIKEELRWARRAFPDLREIALESDTLNAYPELAELCAFLKEEIKTPLFSLLSPLNTTEEMLDMLVDAGLRRVQVGLQTKSGEIEKLYGRERLNRNMDKIFALLKKYEHQGLLTNVDIIVNCPWEKPQHTLETIRYLNKHLPKRFNISIFSLGFIPGTELWEKAKKEGLLDPETYSQPLLGWANLDEIQYTTLLLSLLNLGFPRKFLGLLANKPLVAFFSSKFFTRGVFPKSAGLVKRLVKRRKKLY